MLIFPWRTSFIAYHNLEAKFLHFLLLGRSAGYIHIYQCSTSVISHIIYNGRGTRVGTRVPLVVGVIHDMVRSNSS